MMFDLEKVTLNCDMQFVGGEVHSVNVCATRQPEGSAVLEVLIGRPDHKCCRDCAAELALLALEHFAPSDEQAEVC